MTALPGAAGGDSLGALAAAAGVLRHWTNAAGHAAEVAEDDLRAVLTALGFPADTDAAVRVSLEAAAASADRANMLLTTWCGEHFDAPAFLSPGPALFHLEGGGVLEAVIEESAAGLRVRAPALPGYHVLEARGRQVKVAAAPRGGSQRRGRGFGLAVQIYALDEREGLEREAFGDFGDVARFAELSAARGADALAVSPAHALFLNDPGGFHPYAPSSRLFLNGLFASADRLPPGLTPGGRRGASDEGLILWEMAGPQRVARLRAAFADMQANDPLGSAELEEFRRRHGASLERHVLFEALDADFRRKGVMSRHGWPAAFSNPASAEVRAFGAQAGPEMAFHAFVQHRVHTARAEAQNRALAAGMRIGLIADLAVGLNPNGSDAWSRADEVLTGVSVGAPPDLFQAEGQDWGILGLDPGAMRTSGYALFLETLRANLQDVGGLRIDHAMGLRRLWLVPRGAPASRGAYLSYPESDLLRLIALESARAKALIVGEDLGTVPKGFRERLGDAGILGMSVLWFERDGAKFRAPNAWGAGAMAMTSTHDLATVAGWWRGRDLDWRARQHLDETLADVERAERAGDRTSLWKTLLDAGAAFGPEPAADDPVPALDGALGLISATPCPLALAPVEDLLALDEQVNLPGDVEIHPNWRRRLPGSAARLFETGPVVQRLTVLAERRDP